MEQAKELNKIQQEIREKLIFYTLKNYKEGYDLSYQDIGDIFGLSRQSIHKIEFKYNAKALK